MRDKATEVVYLGVTGGIISISGQTIPILYSNIRMLTSE